MTANGELTLSWGAANDTTTMTTPDNAPNDRKVELVGGRETTTELAALQPDNTIAVQRIVLRAPRNRAENRLAESQILVNPDTGTAGYELDIFFKAYAWGSGSGLERLRNWQRQPNDEGIYENGRIGLKNKRNALYDIDPTADRGYQIANLGFEHEFADDRLTGVLTLRFSGDPSGFGA